MTQLETIADQIREQFEEIDGIREEAIKQSRDIIRNCANAIKAVHRGEWEQADKMLAELRTTVQALVATTKACPQVYTAGYTQDCLKEYVEAEHTYSIVRGDPLKSPDELHVEGAAWLNGLAEASTELRRRILDIMRHGHTTEAEQLLNTMDDVYAILVTFDFRDAITGGLRRRTDTVRAVLERTRGDVTTSLRQTRLEQALENLEKKLDK